MFRILFGISTASLQCWKHFRFYAIVTPRCLTQCMLSSFIPLISNSYIFLFPTLRARHVWTLKGNSHLYDHAEMLCWYSCRPCLSLSKITEFLIFVSSVNLARKLLQRLFENQETHCLMIW